MNILKYDRPPFEQASIITAILGESRCSLGDEENLAAAKTLRLPISERMGCV